MKKIILSFLSALLLTVGNFTAQAQDDGEVQTILSGINQVSGFGGPIMQFGSIKDEFAFKMGGGGAILLNRRFFIGGYGMGLSNEVNHEFDGENLNLDYGHGGFWLGYVIGSNKRVHLALSSQLGWGQASLERELSTVDIYEDNIFVINPVAEVELNLTRFMRVSIGGGYEIVNGLNLEGLNSTDLNSYTVQLAFKFGWFG